jgi:hypothetical protein
VISLRRGPAPPSCGHAAPARSRTSYARRAIPRQPARCWAITTRSRCSAVSGFDASRSVRPEARGAWTSNQAKTSSGAAPGALAQDPADRLAGEARAPRAGARPPGRRGRRRPAHRCASVAGGRATPSGAARGPHRGPRSPPCRSDAHEPRRRAVQAFPAVGTVRRGMSPGRRPSRAPRPKVGARVAGGRRTRVGTQGA